MDKKLVQCYLKKLFFGVSNREKNLYNKIRKIQDEIVVLKRKRTVLRQELQKKREEFEEDLKDGIKEFKEAKNELLKLSEKVKNSQTESEQAKNNNDFNKIFVKVSNIERKIDNIRSLKHKNVLKLFNEKDFIQNLIIHKFKVSNKLIDKLEKIV